MPHLDPSPARSRKAASAGLLAVFLLTLACGGGATGTASTSIRRPVSDGPPTLTPEAVSGGTPASGGPQSSGLPADVETYYMTMVFIEGTGQLLGKLDLAAALNSGNQAAFLPLLAMPGVMDDRLIQAQQMPVPDPLAEAWDKAALAESGMTQALEILLATFSQEDFNRDVAAQTSLASEAVQEAETVLATQYDADSDTIAALHTAALTEMDEAYQQFASLLLVGQSQTESESP